MNDIKNILNNNNMSDRESNIFTNIGKLFNPLYIMTLFLAALFTVVLAMPEIKNMFFSNNLPRTKEDSNELPEIREDSNWLPRTGEDSNTLPETEEDSNIISEEEIYNIFFKKHE